jgi:hypothetical protein
MTTDRSTKLPPAWAEGLLRLVLAPNDRETVSGDLLEEFRESIVPALGARANVWYVRQVVGFVVREVWAWAALVAAICIVRYLFDTMLPIHYTPGVVAERSAVMTWSLIGTVVSCAAWHAWRTHRVSAAILLVVISAFVGGLLAQAGSLLCLALWHDPATLDAIRGSGGFGEAFIDPSIGLALGGLAFGLPGAIVGWLARVVQGWSSANTKMA